LDFVTEYADFITEYIPTPREWAEGIACALLGVALGPERKVYTRIGGLGMNTFWLIVGPSGLAYKTVPLKYFAIPTLAALTKRVNYPCIMPARFSLEGLIGYMAEGRARGCIVRDEFTALLKSARREYLQEILEFVSELYDGVLQKRYTKSYRLEQAVDVFICLLSTTTPYLFRIMKPEFFIQGTGNRFLFVWVEEVKAKTTTGEELFPDWARIEERDRRIEEFADVLAGVWKSNINYLVPDRDASELLASYRNQLEVKAVGLYRKDMYDVMHSYVHRLFEYAVKLSGLKAASRSVIAMAKTTLNEMLIGESDVRWAINKVNEHFGQFERMVEVWRTRPVPREAITLEEQVRTVMKVVNSNPGVKWSELRRLTRWSRGTWREVLKYLWDTDQIVVVVPKGAAHRPPVLFYPKPEEVNALMMGEKVEGWQLLLIKLGLRD